MSGLSSREFQPSKSQDFHTEGKMLSILAPLRQRTFSLQELIHRLQLARLEFFPDDNHGDKYGPFGLFVLRHCTITGERVMQRILDRLLRCLFKQLSKDRKESSWSCSELNGENIKSLLALSLLGLAPASADLLHLFDYTQHSCSVNNDMLLLKLLQSVVQLDDVFQYHSRTLHLSLSAKLNESSVGESLVRVLSSHDLPIFLVDSLKQYDFYSQNLPVSTVLDLPMHVAQMPRAVFAASMTKLAEFFSRNPDLLAILSFMSGRLAKTGVFNLDKQTTPARLPQRFITSQAAPFRPWDSEYQYTEFSLVGELVKMVALLHANQQISGAGHVSDQPFGEAWFERCALLSRRRQEPVSLASANNEASLPPNSTNISKRLNSFASKLTHQLLSDAINFNAKQLNDVTASLIKPSWSYFDSRPVMRRTSAAYFAASKSTSSSSQLPMRKRSSHRSLQLCGRLQDSRPRASMPSGLAGSKGSLVVSRHYRSVDFQPPSQSRSSQDSVLSLLWQSGRSSLSSSSAAYRRGGSDLSSRRPTDGAVDLLSLAEVLEEAPACSSSTADDASRAPLLVSIPSASTEVGSVALLERFAEVQSHLLLEQAKGAASARLSLIGRMADRMAGSILATSVEDSAPSSTANHNSRLPRPPLFQVSSTREEEAEEQVSSSYDRRGRYLGRMATGRGKALYGDVRRWPTVFPSQEQIFQKFAGSLTTRLFIQAFDEIMVKPKPRPVLTGVWWGCGRDKGGDAQIKAILWWIAAAVTSRDAHSPIPVVFGTANDERLSKIVAAVERANWSAGELFQCLLDYCQLRRGRWTHCGDIPFRVAPDGGVLDPDAEFSYPTFVYPPPKETPSFFDHLCSQLDLAVVS